MDPRIKFRLGKGKEPPTETELQTFVNSEGKLKLDIQTKNHITAAVFLYGKIDKYAFWEAASPALKAFLSKTDPRDPFNLEVKRSARAVAMDVRMQFFDRFRRFTTKTHFLHGAEKEYMDVRNTGKAIQLDGWYEQRMDKDQLLYLLAPFAKVIDLERMLDDKKRQTPDEESQHQILKAFTLRLCCILATLTFVHKVCPEILYSVDFRGVCMDYKRVHEVFDGVRGWCFGLNLEDLPLRLMDIEEEGKEDSEGGAKEGPTSA